MALLHWIAIFYSNWKLLIYDEIYLNIKARYFATRVGSGLSDRPNIEKSAYMQQYTPQSTPLFWCAAFLLLSPSCGNHSSELIFSWAAWWSWSRSSCTRYLLDLMNHNTSPLSPAWWWPSMSNALMMPILGWASSLRWWSDPQGNTSLSTLQNNYSELLKEEKSENFEKSLGQELDKSTVKFYSHKLTT